MLHVICYRVTTRPLKDPHLQWLISPGELPASLSGSWVEEEGKKKKKSTEKLILEVGRPLSPVTGERCQRMHRIQIPDRGNIYQF